MIDPLETVIQYLKTAGLSTDQIASKHRYGGTWTNGTPAFVVKLDGGTPNVDLPLHDVRLEVNCYAASQYAAYQMLWEIVSLCRLNGRVEVPTQNGMALLHYLLPASGPSAQFDDSQQMDFALQFFAARVSEQEVD